MLLTTIAGPVVLNQAEQGRVLEVLIYFSLIYIVLPVLLVLWLVFLIKNFAKHQKASKLLRLNIIASVTAIVTYVIAAPTIDLLFGKL